MGTKIKYLGTSDVHTLAKGENFGGRLADPLEKTVSWDADKNHHLVDSDAAGLSPEAVTLLLLDTNSFKDVTDAKLIPSSANEQIFRGAPKSRDLEIDEKGNVTVKGENPNFSHSAPLAPADRGVGATASGGRAARRAAELAAQQNEESGLANPPEDPAT